MGHAQATAPPWCEEPAGQEGNCAITPWEQCPGQHQGEKVRGLGLVCIGPTSVRVRVGGGEQEKGEAKGRGQGRGGAQNDRIAPGEAIRRTGRVLGMAPMGPIRARGHNRDFENQPPLARRRARARLRSQTAKTERVG